MRLREMIQGVDSLHGRGISVKTFPVSDDRVVVEGRLDDERMVTVYRPWDAEPKEAGPVHGMCARFLVGDHPLCILDAEAEMTTVPNSLCQLACQSVKKLIGQKIVSGYSERVRQIIGGANGCAHLTHLAVVMGPAAVHGCGVLYARRKRPMPGSWEEVAGLDYIVNSCHLWTPEGPFMDQLKAVIQDHSQKRGQRG